MKYLLLILILPITISSLHAQENVKTLPYKVRGINKNIEYTEIANKKEFQNKHKDKTAYTLDSLNFYRLKRDLILIEKLSELNQLLKNRNEKTEAIKIVYDTIINTQENNIELYRKSYSELKAINKNLNQELEKSIDIGKKAAKRKSFTKILLGVLSGFAIGTIISN